MANRALKIDDSLFEPGVPAPAPAPSGPDGARIAGSLADRGRASPDPAAPEGAPAAQGAGLTEAAPATGSSPDGDSGPADDLALAAAGSLAGEEAMVRAFNQLRDAVRQATRERDAGAGDPAAATDLPAEPGRETLEATGAPAMREDALFAFGPGGGRVFLSGGAGWTDVVRLQGIAAPPGPGSWSLELEAGAATEVDGAILLSEDAAGTVRLADGAELVFDGIERIEW
ncbi:MAG: hypothetical protein RIB82_29185 [Sneathiellaceae bacterium]